MTTDSVARLGILRGDLTKFAPECLKIRTKDEKIEPMVLNAPQLAAHKLIEQQKAEKGWVRALILKGRQQGISTYVAARYYHRASMRRAVNVYILSHEQTSSDTLFGIVERYQTRNPFAPHVGVSNAKELIFDKLDSSYAVATAGTKAGGRGKAVSLFHGSEVAFWTNARDHFAASVQGVPLAPGTEVILESTSAGAGGEFYERWQMAEAKEGDYIGIFLPWWLSNEYAREPETGFKLEQESTADAVVSEQEYQDLWKLSLSQMAWRRAKILELRDPLLFQREYPADPSEAWTAPPGHEPFINAVDVLRARKRRTEEAGPLIIGVDPAGSGGDRFAMAARRGFCIPYVKYRNKLDTLQGTAWCREVIDRENPARMNIDCGGIGAAIVTNLQSLGPRYVGVIRGVNFGGTSEAKLALPKVPGPRNRRAEMWARSREWLKAPEGASIPDDSELQSDATGPKEKPQLSGDFLLESKLDMKKRQVRSPDGWDAVSLTFAFIEYLTGWSGPAKVTQFGHPDTEQPGQSDTWQDPMTGVPTGWMS